MRLREGGATRYSAGMGKATAGTLADRLTLWTWQMPGFEIDRDAVNVKKSEIYRTRPELRTKYKMVKHVTGVHPLWCFTEPALWRASPIGGGVGMDVEKGLDAGGVQRVRWVLSVPVAEVLGFVDEWMSYRLLEVKPGRCPEGGICGQWLREAGRQTVWTGGSSAEWAAIESMRFELVAARLAMFKRPWVTKAYWKWCMLTNEERGGGGGRVGWVSALLPSPVPSAWVVERPGG